MTRDELRARLHAERSKYTKWPYAKFFNLKKDIHRHFGHISGKYAGDDFYQVSVRVLEREADYVLVGISVDDGREQNGFVIPETVTLKIYRNGRVE